MSTTLPETLAQPELRPAAPRTGAPPGVVLVGNANVGKSALFGALTGTYVTVSNYPGTTVEVTRGATHVGGQRLEVIDTPGTASFLPSSEDERVTRDILLAGRPHAVVVVGDAKNLERTLLLAVQLSEMGLPHVLCLNMMDEAAARGMAVDARRLSERLRVAVIPTVAVRREGLKLLQQSLEAPRPGAAFVPYPEAIEKAVAVLEPLLPEAPIQPRALALMVLAGDQTLDAWLRARLDEGRLRRIEEARESCCPAGPEALAYSVNQARLNAVARLMEGIVTRDGAARPARAALKRFEALTTHPVWGLPILAAVLWLAFQFVGVFGAQTLVELLEDGLFGKILSPAATAFFERFVPWAFVRDLFVGPYGVITMALAYSLALVLPIVGTFFIAFGVLEDSGYLPRLAVMVNGIFKRIGLNGKAVLPMVLGLGCDTMATLTTRILETPKERLIVITLLALGVPCSAQLTVILAMFSGLPTAAFVIWLTVVLATIALVGRLASAVLPGRGSDFILELPPLRLPQLGNIALKTLARIEWYLKEAVPLFVVGTLILFGMDRLHLLGGLQRLCEPLLSGLLGLPRETAEAFVIGFLRRDFGAAGFYKLAEQGRLDLVQTVVAMVTITLFIPCIANFLMMVKERGLKTGLLVAGFILPFAIGVGAVLNWALRAWPVF